MESQSERNDAEQRDALDETVKMCSVLAVACQSNDSKL